jgi:hypothetical protein
VALAGLWVSGVILLINDHTMTFFMGKEQLENSEDVVILKSIFPYDRLHLSA